MAKRVIWSFTAQADRKQILQYWTAHNKSRTYSQKLNKAFQAAVSLISDYPHIGVPTAINQIRSKVVLDY